MPKTMSLRFSSKRRGSNIDIYISGGDLRVLGIQGKWLNMCFSVYFEEVLIVSTVVLTYGPNFD